MNLLSLLTYTSSIIYLFFGFYILYLNKSEIINKIFFLLSVSLSIWSFADAFYFTASDKESAMTFWRISSIGWIFSPSIMLHLMLLIGKFRKFIDNWMKITIIYIPAVILQVLALTTNFYLKDIILTPYGWADYVDNKSPITISFLIYFITYSLLSLLATFTWGKNTKIQHEKKQAATIFIASILSLIPIFFANTMQIAFGTKLLIPTFAEIFILIWVAGIMIAIKKYNFLRREEEITILNEKILLESKIVSIQSEYIKNQNYVLETLLDYFKKNSQIDIYDFIAEKIYQTGNIKILMITTYDSSSSKFILKSIKCDKEIKHEFERLIRSYIGSPEAKIPEADKDFIIEKLFQSHLIKLDGGLYEAILKKIDKSKIDEFANKYALGEAYSIGFSSGNTLYGAATIICEKNKDIENKEFLEVLINILSLILQKWDTDIKLKKSEELHRAIFEYSDDCIYILNKDGHLLSINPSFERITGYKVEDFINKSMVELLHPEDVKEAFKMLKMVISGFNPLRKILRVIDSKNNVLYGEFSATKFILDNGEIALLGIGRDITERIRNEELIKTYQKELELKTTRIETIGIMAIGVLHDLNNILMNISTKIDKMKKIDLQHNDITEYLNEIYKTIDVAKRLSKGLFHISSGRISEFEDGTLIDIIKENLNLLVKDSKYTLKTEFPEDIEDIQNLPIDNPKITQILNNLVINAIQAMPNGGTIKVSLAHHQINERNFIVLSVSDTGPGIPNEIRERIFDPFFTTKPNGTGLGLYTVKSIIKAAGGEIEFFSEYGKGTTFKIYLPVNKDKKSIPHQQDKKEKKERVAKNVLIVDDDKNIRELTVDMLTYLGHRPFTAHNSETALYCIKNNTIDAVILDVHLGSNSDALWMLKKIKELKKDTKVIVCSGSPKDSYLIHFDSYGFEGVLTKPFTLNDLENILK
ncbi:MAG: ATP-binding protein [Deltaproteobacteria bacterium]|nr:ATP-binding protein [Deltaproteobacteria bacterium]